jgi:hypothetical protein
MSLRIRHCIECPKCHTRYVIGASPYRNGAYLVSRLAGDSEAHTLYCCCGKPPASTRWNELKTYIVSNQAHDRGYGSPREIVLTAST